MLNPLLQLRRARRGWYGMSAVVCLAAGMVLAWHHPLWPAAALVLLAFATLLGACSTTAWLLVVPACLPFLQFAPWTGWLIFDEFDLLLLGTLAGGYSRLLWTGRSPAFRNASARGSVLLWLFGAVSALALWRGFADAGGFVFDWFAGYADALNSVRVAKSLAFALLLVPLVRAAAAPSRRAAANRLALGVVGGLAITALVIVWERAAYPGFMDFASSYRTTALFWEMHVGGEAIDAYLVLTAPFVVWAVVSARRTTVWLAACALAVLVVYACLTSFSRGVYIAVTIPLLLLLAQLRSRGQLPAGGRGRANRLVALLLLAEVVGVLMGGAFMRDRLESSERDLGGRLLHWRMGAALTLQSPEDVWLGLGLGRFPANYARYGRLGEFSGTLHWQAPQDGMPAFVTLRGPDQAVENLGLFRMAQRVGRASAGPYNVALEVRVAQPLDLTVALCEKHLLYNSDCQVADLHVEPVATRWQTLHVTLDGPALGASPWYAPRYSEFSIAPRSLAADADITHVQLAGPGRPELLKNADFSADLAHWYTGAHTYFLPWHIDNQYLDVLIERGLAGLLLYGCLMVVALRALLAASPSATTLGIYVAASLVGVMLLGLVSSWMDVPRVAFLQWLFVVFALEADMATPAKASQTLA